MRGCTDLGPDFVRDLYTMLYAENAQAERDTLAFNIRAEGRWDGENLDSFSLVPSCCKHQKQRLMAQRVLLQRMIETCPRMLKREVVSLYVATVGLIAELDKHAMIIPLVNLEELGWYQVKASYAALVAAHEAETNGISALYERIRNDTGWKLEFETYSQKVRGW